MKETPEQSGPPATTGQLARLAAANARAERGAGAPASGPPPTQMFPTQLKLRPRKRRQPEGGGGARGARPRGETRRPGTAAEGPRGRPKKGPGPFGCSKCRWAGGGCGSCNQAKAAAAARRKRARAVPGPLSGPQWVGQALREELPPPPLPARLEHPLAAGAGAPARVRFFQDFSLSGSNLSLGDFVELQAPGAVDDRPVVGRLEALWEESSAGPAAAPARKFARCRRFYYLSEVAQEAGPEAGGGVLSSDVILDRVALDHVVRGCGVGTEATALPRAQPGYLLRGHYDILTQEWVALKSA